MQSVRLPAFIACGGIDGAKCLAIKLAKKMETTNNLKFTTNRTKKGIDYIIKIRLNDECKNGHNDFSITGDMYLTGKQYTDRNNQGGGAIGDEISRCFPEYKIFSDLHLCDAKGAPIYAQANGFYHLKNSSKEVVLSYLRINSAEYDTLLIAEDQAHFTYILDNILQIPERWQKEALQAVDILEGMTGLKFKDDSTRSQFTPLSDDIASDIEFKIKSGYYLPENIKNREAKKLADAKAKIIEGLKSDRDKGVKKYNDEYNVKLCILNAGLPLDNFIYYNHTNTGVFNWKGYDKKITDEQFNTFLADTDFSKLKIEGLTFKIGETK